MSILRHQWNSNVRFALLKECLLKNSVETDGHMTQEWQQLGDGYMKVHHTVIATYTYVGQFP